MSMNQNKTAEISNREVKSSAFTTLFSDPKNAAQLYSALEDVQVSPGDIRYTTLEGVLFIARKNDMAFTVKNRVLVISEHQSTLNSNMPLRDIIYYGRTMEKLIDKRALYRNRQIPIPTPEFFVFYNGNEPFPSEKILKLSDSYLEKASLPMLECRVKVININLPENHSILQKCRPLYEYSWFIQRIRKYMAEGAGQDAAIIHAVKDCEKENILAEFVQEHGSEVINMLYTQFNMEDALEVRYEEGFEDGEIKGAEKKLVELVCRKLAKGKSSKTIAEELEEALETVTKICDAAEKCGSCSDTEAVLRALQNI